MLRALQVGVAATMLTLGAGCSSPEVDVPDRLLQPDDLPAVEKVDVVDRSAVSRVGCADLALEYNLTITDGADATAVYTLRSGDEVRSAVQGTRLTATGIDHTLEELRSMIDRCESTSPHEFTSLDLPGDAVGFRDTADSSRGAVVTERAYAPVDDRSAVVVTTIHRGDGEAEVSVAELVATALRRAEG